MARILVSSESFANVDSANLVLPRGQRGYDSATGEYRTGNGLSAWADLPIDGGRAADPTPYVQTHSTADKTLDAYTSDPESTAYTAAGVQDAAKLVDINALRVAYENLRVFTEDAVEMLNAVVDDLQALSLAN